jgi:hypothetical protein
MALWKDQSPSTTILSFRQDGVIYELERCEPEDTVTGLHYRLTLGNLFTFKSSRRFASFTNVVNLAHRIANADTDKQRQAIVDKEF